MAFRLRSLLCLVALLTAIAPTAWAQRPSKPGGLRTYLTGNSADSSRQPVGGPAIVLMGGNFDIDEAFQNRVYPIANGGDIVVLRTNASNGYQSYLYNMPVPSNLKPDSVETMVVNTRSKANSAYVRWVIETAEFVYIAGGDQSEYLNYWKDTALEDALRFAYNRGAVIGGISAGCAVMGQFMYDPDGVLAVITSEAVANPYRSSMIISDGFADFPLMSAVITDTHFYQRDRMGRLAAFMARLREDGRTGFILGIGVDEDTSFFIDRNALGVVDGDGYVYVLEEDSQTVRTQVDPGLPLIYRGIKQTRLGVGKTYNLDTGATTGSTIRMDVDGRTPNSPYTPTNPY